jgi:hypothetical protein
MEFNSNPSSRGSMDPLPFSWTESDGEPNESAVRVTPSQLKRRTKFGVFLWWSDQIPTWVHPDDVQTAERLVPGYRVFKRSECENSSDRELGYSIFQYGQEWFRGKPALWLEIKGHGFEIGDLIEIRSLHGKLHPQIAVITAILWNQNSLATQYFVSVNEARIQRPFSIDEIRPAIRLGKHLSPRELRLATRRSSSAE